MVIPEPNSGLDGLNLDAHSDLVFFHFPRLSDLSLFSIPLIDKSPPR